MIKAVDAKGNSVLADNAEKGSEYRCPACGKRVILKRADAGIRIPHFAHDSKCLYPFEKEYMSEWHLRMQSYFPENSREVYFTDSETGEKHRADVFLSDSNTVIEIQKSPITTEEYSSRTLFHLKNGRRIIWIFSESIEKEKTQNPSKLKPAPDHATNEPHKHLTYQWRYKRNCFSCNDLPRIEYWNNDTNYAVYLYLGEGQEDVIHRIIGEDEDFKYITLSMKNLRMCSGMTGKEFFVDEKEWIPAGSKWKDIFDRYREGLKALKEYDKKQDELLRKENERLKEEKKKKEDKRINDLLFGTAKRNWWL